MARTPQKPAPKGKPPRAKTLKTSELDLPFVEMDWTKREIESFMNLIQGEPAAPAPVLIKLIRG